MSEQIEPQAATKKAREISKWAMVTAALWIGVLSLVKGFWPLFAAGEFSLSMQDIILSGLAVAGVFSPVFLSIFIDKIKGEAAK
jgi:hypothetical protein